jgi:uncharacterized protein YndB with AHSA1/START domain
LKLIKEIETKAPAEKVWEFIANTDFMEQWLMRPIGFPLKVGQEFYFSSSCEGKESTIQCKILEFETNKRLKFSWVDADFNLDSVVEIQLRESHGITKILFKQTGWQQEGTPKSMHEKTWTECLLALDALVLAQNK